MLRLDHTQGLVELIGISYLGKSLLTKEWIHPESSVVYRKVCRVDKRSASRYFSTVDRGFALPLVGCAALIHLTKALDYLHFRLIDAG